MHHLTRRLGRLLTTATAAVLVAAVAAPAAHAAAPAPRATAPVGGGQLVLVGGSLSDSNTEIYGEIVRRAGGATAHIGVITAASVPKSQDPDVGTKWESNSEFNGAFYSDLLEKYGAGDAEYIPVDLDHIAAADDPALAAKVRSMTGFFFGGGDQYRLVQVLQRGPKQRDSKVLAAIRAAFEGGAVVAGTSAGAQIQAGADMVTGGESWEGLVAGATPGYFDDATKLGYLPEGGFGFFRSGLLDTHFTAYGREGRAIRLAADTGNRRVFGLDPNTALVVDHAGTASEELSVIGQRGISVLDLAAARTSTDAAGRWAIDGVRWTWLTRGDRYDPRHDRTTAAGDTAYLSPVDRPVAVETDDVFSSLRGTSPGYELIGLARDIVATTQSSASGTTLEHDPQFTVTLTRAADTSARTRDGSTAVAFSGLVLGIHAS
ncbi:cyanophycinase [Intrasporangium oryzae NRRL B-24470]|uniref:Cyanophycinase n=1 Tax=Intrasporangium oryzae NRRL B-24470 TaxID=1386089 RepID=W9GB88_9MICO|nr:cyanophycinase [Intrasporangium oryzae]EWT02078.1 cyanophycinase [Intrasporangium oryzae NRRL B-24470]